METTPVSIVDITQVRSWDLPRLARVDDIFKPMLVRLGEKKANIVGYINRPVNRWQLALQLANKNNRKTICSDIEDAAKCIDELVRDGFLQLEIKPGQTRPGEGENVSFTSKGRQVHDYLMRRRGSPIIIANDGPAESTK